MAPTPSTNPPTLAHMIIFYPPLAEIPLSNPPADKDLAEDLHQASQILFYTSHASSGVSRDVMLRQLGLVKGLMSFSGYVRVCRGVLCSAYETGCWMRKRLIFMRSIRETREWWLLRSRRT